MAVGGHAGNCGPQSAACVTGNDAPLIIERAATRAHCDGMSAVMRTNAPSRNVRGERRDRGGARLSRTYGPTWVVVPGGGTWARQRWTG